MAARKPPDNMPPGPGVDAVGRSVIDPSENVKALAKADTRRQDDLRKAEGRAVRRELHLEVVALRREIRQEAKHAKDLRNAEAKRIDAIRTVDVAAVQRAAEVAAEAVTTLATQVPITAEAVRLAQAQALDPILKRLDDLSRAQFEQQGKGQGVSDAQRSQDRTRTLVFGLVAAAIAVLGYLGITDNKPAPTVVQVPAVTTPTTVAP